MTEHVTSEKVQHLAQHIVNEGNALLRIQDSNKNEKSGITDPWVQDLIYEVAMAELILDDIRDGKETTEDLQDDWRGLQDTNIFDALAKAGINPFIS